MKVFRLILVALVALAAFANENPTTELLRAHPISNFVRIGLVPEQQGGDKYTLLYGVDAFEDLDPLPNGIVFRTDNGADIYLAYYNPLTQSFVINSESVPDVSYASLKTFLEDLQKAQANIAPPPAGTGGGDEKAKTPCEELVATINQLHERLHAPAFDGPRLKKIVDEASGFGGVTAAANDLNEDLTTINKEITDAESLLASLRKDFSSIGGATPNKDCLGRLQADLRRLYAIKATKRSTEQNSEIKTLEDERANVRAAIDRYNKIEKDADKIIAAKKALRDSIETLLKSLDPFLVRARWRGKNVNDDLSLTDWDLNKKITPDFVNQQKVSVVAKAKDVVLERDVVVVKEAEATKQTADFRVRQDSMFIPERAVAVIYNRLKYPKYATKKNDAGKTVVDKTEDEDPWNGAVLLNLVMRSPRPSVFSPMLQLGVSTAKDYPGFVAGAGLRFTQPVALGLSFGGLITRYKDLDDELQVGSEVTGDADIDKHLEYRWSPIVPYFAVQVKF